MTSPGEALRAVGFQYRSSLKNVEEILRPAVSNITRDLICYAVKIKHILLIKNFFSLIFVYLT